MENDNVLGNNGSFSKEPEKKRIRNATITVPAVIAVPATKNRNNLFRNLSVIDIE